MAPKRPIYATGWLPGISPRRIFLKDGYQVWPPGRQCLSAATVLPGTPRSRSGEAIRVPSAPTPFFFYLFFEPDYRDQHKPSMGKRQGHGSKSMWGKVRTDRYLENVSFLLIFRKNPPKEYFQRHWQSTFLPTP
jgi:hypothetical protein